MDHAPHVQSQSTTSARGAVRSERSRWAGCGRRGAANRSGDLDAAGLGAALWAGALGAYIGWPSALRHGRRRPSCSGCGSSSSPGCPQRLPRRWTHAGTSEHHEGAGSLRRCRSGSFAAGVQALSPGPAGRAAARLFARARRRRGVDRGVRALPAGARPALGAHSATAYSTNTSPSPRCRRRCGATPRGRSAGRVRCTWLAAALPGEAHTLPLDALAAALAEVGCASSVLYDVPGPTLYAAVQRHPGAVVVLWTRGQADLALLRGVCSLAPGYAPPVRDGAAPDY